jgi:hypothetical protein
VELWDRAEGIVDGEVVTEVVEGMWTYLGRKSRLSTGSSLA